MMVDPIYAFDILADGTGRHVTNGDVAPAADAAYRWTHFDLHSEGMLDWLSAEIDPVVALSLTRQDTRPSVHDHENGLVIVLRGVNLNPESDPEDMVSIRIWVQKDRIISTRMRRLMAIVAMRERIESGKAPASPADFIATLAAGLTERMFPVVTELSDHIDDLEEQSISRASGLRTELADIRRSTIALRRYISPQRDALARLATDPGDWLGRKAQLRLREIADQVTRLVEELDSIRDRCGILNDQLADRRAEEMNTNMMVLSVVAAIFLPLGFLTGLLGINVGGMPGADNPIAFYIVCGLCAAIGGGLTWYFRKKGWF
ncbi:zinc transporter ZntB [Hyphobacterium sp. HN65]|uniref:Zinc transporter ZntB n=1 Tax=Hyphobacterium lacteum TaxID=3116575 RepID=A0ABU7LLV4_9PROT|nr:zinc transporter ZntB [Hyphobacterium sp. HN65]MEE2524862.1 zinc transporter ZntB [Hyphobacterium sp. HN65]